MSGRFAAEFREWIKLAQPTEVRVRTITSTDCGEYIREAIAYEGDDGREIPAFLFIPKTTNAVGGMAVFHQNAGQFHLGKSEVAGLAGTPLQAFGPALARRGLAVLAPDADTFEDRRAQTTRIEPHEKDWLQHYNGMAYRLINGDLIMRKHLDDGQRAVSASIARSQVAPAKIGISGHSVGGTISLYLGALYERCRFVCSSGAAGSFTKRQATATGFGMIELVPALAARYGVADVIGAIPPRELLLVSGAQDEYSSDVDHVLEQAGLTDVVHHVHASGGHELDSFRFDAIVDWLFARATSGK